MAGRPRSDPSARVKPDSCWFRAWRELESWACAARQSSAGPRPVRPPGLPWAAAADAAPKRRRRRSWREIRPAMPAAFRFRHQAAGVLAAPARACRRMGPHKCPNGRPRMPKRRPLSCRKRGSLPRRRGRAGRLGDPSQWAGFEGRRSARSRSRGREKLGPSFRSAARAGRAPPGLVCDPCKAGAASVLPRRAPAPSKKLFKFCPPSSSSWHLPLCQTAAFSLAVCPPPLPPLPLSLFTTQFMLPSIHIPPQAGDAARRCILTCVGARAHCCSGEWRMMREPPSLLRTPSRVGSGHIPRRSSVEAIAKQKLRAGEGETEAGRKGGREGPPPPHHSRAAAQPPTSVPQW